MRVKGLPKAEVTKYLPQLQIHKNLDLQVGTPSTELQVPSSKFQVTNWILRRGRRVPLRAFASVASPYRNSQRLNSPILTSLCALVRQLALSWHILALLGLILSPRCSKMAPRWPNIAQHRTKMNQHGLQEHSKTFAKTATSVLLSSFVVFHQF